MKHIVIYILLILVFAGCNPCKRLIRLCPPSDSISYIETIDTLIIQVPANTSITELPLDALGLTQEDEKQKVVVLVHNDTIVVKTTCKSQEIEILSLRKQLASQKTIIERVEIPTYVTKNSKYHTTAGILAPLLVLALAGAIVLLFKR